MNAPENVKALRAAGEVGEGQASCPPSRPGAHHLALQRGQGGDGLLRPVVPGRDREATSTTASRRCPRIDEAGGKPMRPWMTVEGVFVAAQSKNKDAAFEFAKYVTGRRGGEGHGARRAADARRTRRSTTTRQVATDPVLQAFRKQVEVAVPMPNLAEMTMVWSPATTAMNKVKKAATPKAGAGRRRRRALEKDVAAPAEEVREPGASASSRLRFGVGLLLGLCARPWAAAARCSRASGGRSRTTGRPAGPS